MSSGPHSRTNCLARIRHFSNDVLRCVFVKCEDIDKTPIFPRSNDALVTGFHKSTGIRRIRRSVTDVPILVGIACGEADGVFADCPQLNARSVLAVTLQPSFPDTFGAPSAKIFAY